MNQEKENNQGNPEIGMQADSFESAESAAPISGSKEFFNAIENEVNGQIIDKDPEVTQDNSSSSEQVTYENAVDGSNRSGEQSRDGTDWQKRYADSSREAVKWRDKFQEVEKFLPVLQAMKQDSGLVEHVRDYLTGGGKPAKSIQEQLELGEDFIFDQHEAMTNPESDSAKLMNAHVDGLVQQRVTQMADYERNKIAQAQKTKSMRLQEEEFKKSKNMTDAEYASFKEAAKTHKMTLDDIHYLLNRDKVANNVADSAKKDMVNQMQNVRSMPTSASGVNSQGGKQENPDRDVFNAILGFDGGTDNLFG